VGNESGESAMARITEKKGQKIEYKREVIEPTLERGRVPLRQMRSH